MPFRLFSVVALTALLSVSACAPPASDGLVVYSGRSKSLVDSLITRFTTETGIAVDVRYGDTAQLAVALLEEGDRSPADVFWAQDAGALGAVQAAGRFAALPDSMLARVPAAFRSAAGTWVGTSGRARSLAYAPDRVSAESLPTSILDLTDPRFRNRVGWAPTNGSFQAAVTAMRKAIGDDATRAWLVGMRENGARAFGNNRGILEGIANGEVDLGLPNHYYLYPYRAADPMYPVQQTFFAAGDPGNLVNVAGAGVLGSSSNQEAANRFVAWLLGSDSQAYFATENFEYPVVPGVAIPAVLAGPALEGMVPAINLDDLRDLEATLAMLRDTGLL